jgi:acyl transferase domain-containing protein
VLVESVLGGPGEDGRLLGALGSAWLAGVDPRWGAAWQGRTGRRVPLPGYPYQRRPHWAEPDPDLALYDLWTVAGPVPQERR